MMGQGPHVDDIGPSPIMLDFLGQDAEPADSYLESESVGCGFFWAFSLRCGEGWPSAGVSLGGMYDPDWGPLSPLSADELVTLRMA